MAADGLLDDGGWRLSLYPFGLGDVASLVDVTWSLLGAALIPSPAHRSRLVARLRRCPALEWHRDLVLAVPHLSMQWSGK
ncbi:hypothetical protein E2562_029007 [Oryza meyeriana var. granulata]|uniref:Uncharacterized protein n=1 Tax=Oryza meyeriana var. granulata TaxID=110450 RepID=A0A6G1E3V2_9ORYZ|nr:hypothetical protein E2562_029007 [Oryza meyeriana var. granulata]